MNSVHVEKKIPPRGRVLSYTSVSYIGRGNKKIFSNKRRVSRSRKENKYRPNTQQEVFFFFFSFSTNSLFASILSLLSISWGGGPEGAYRKERGARDLPLSARTERSLRVPLHLVSLSLSIVFFSFFYSPFLLLLFLFLSAAAGDAFLKLLISNILNF